MMDENNIKLTPPLDGIVSGFEQRIKRLESRHGELLKELARQGRILASLLERINKIEQI